MRRMVVFDMAGTTIDENNVVYKCVQKALNEYQIPATLQHVLEFGAGKEKLQAIKDVYAEVMQVIVAEETAQTIYDIFSQLLHDSYEIIDMKLYDGLRSTLFFLYKRDVKVVFNTGYTKDLATKILKKVDCIVGESY